MADDFSDLTPTVRELRPFTGSFSLSPYTERGALFSGTTAFDEDGSSDLTVFSRPATASSSATHDLQTLSNTVSQQSIGKFSVTSTLFSQVYNPPRPKTAPSRPKAKSKANSKGKAVARPVTTRPKTSAKKGAVKPPARPKPPTLDLALLVSKPESFTNRMSMTQTRSMSSPEGFSESISSTTPPLSASTLPSECLSRMAERGIIVTQETADIVTKGLLTEDIPSTMSERLLVLPDSMFGCKVKPPEKPAKKKKKKKGKGKGKKGKKKK
ncbi:uncharacterized protein MONOS_14697 [Monocercomonoides exilis]|uniref:uncharacterized protein n=1 Tax=Monocercomonoides exilis TaxID=2049356 RepID=UPI00355A74DE|nr:hypothetical protein MONOS_14697 [Monocercomonoides exilis]|eukprot:MONOS_14697.1-p1 / transcript=MONOS_14697.1 / gene=MONOS_14697 / organism=Monocercomonoides_exilis_PA203 / gene_product=unspecified product / transcript_product=unspecified product / location=Mono_scaffold01053:5788-7283(-) / protein_length=269 / sequence_SO=supercontig / SO=protein_coding / is_pseudo=false